jgi:predicted 3-demethylubiquinone-9 3-methyltransferase (glyoxalase superfamily)
MEFSQKIAPCLWFASEAEEAARYYTGIFPNSKIGKIARYGKAGFETHQQKPGTVLTVQFELAGQTFTALNGGQSSNSTKPSRCRSISKTRRSSISTGTSHRRRRSQEPGAAAQDKYGLSWQWCAKDGRVVWRAGRNPIA